MHLADGSVEERVGGFSDPATDNTVSTEELDKIWSSNAFVPESVQGCVHDLITENARHHPDKVAVCAWDGDFTFWNFDTMADDFARHLVGLGIQPKSSIPLLFEKSKWTCVAMLGIIKAGCSAIALDATQPDARLRSIVQQVQPKHIVSSATNCARAHSLAEVSIIQLGSSFLERGDRAEEALVQLPAVSPSDIVYISFTSGTTGQPKGACISHANVRSAVHHQGKKLGFLHGSRVFDFAPYSFDVAWSNFLHTLCAGGCICIAKEEEMMNDLSSAITNFKATLINVTPTILRTINSKPPTLETVLLSGEMPYRENMTRWGGQVRLLNTYGPTECTFKCAFSILSPTQEGRPDIGTGVGFCTWIVSPPDSNIIVKRGSVGELCLEGPLVGQGYLSDTERTASAFIDDPHWLVKGSNSTPGRRGRVYKTGDLVKSKPDGKILFIGRKDTSQLKIRGQRVEIGDVEHHVRIYLPDELPIIADVVIPRDNDSAALALFVKAKEQDKEKVRISMDGLTDKLLEVLPAFMIPSVYIPIDEIPLAGTGKVDRKALRELGSSLKWKEIIALQSTILTVRQFQEPSDALERQIRILWSDILHLDVNRISTTDSFFRLGGDSVAAMHLVAAARQNNLFLTVANIFKAPELSALAQVASVQAYCVDDKREKVAKFSLLSKNSDESIFRQAAAKLCAVETEDIEDIFPTTPLQQGMFALTARNEGEPLQDEDYPIKSNYISRSIFTLPKDFDIGLFHSAWAVTSNAISATRARIIDLSGEGLVQVVIQAPAPLYSYTRIGDLLGSTKRMTLGSPLCEASLVGGTPHYFVLDMHHAMFDGHSTALILDTLEAAYKEIDKIPPPLTPFQTFIEHILATNNDRAADFWRKELAGSEASIFPSPHYSPGRKLDLNHPISGLKWPCTGITASTLVRSALTVLLASYTNSEDIKYGATVSGRGAPVPGIERIAGPTIATIPVRTKFDWDQTVESLQKQIQQQAVEVTGYEQFGLQRIQRIDEETSEASKFQLLLVVQPAERRTSQIEGGLFSQPKTTVRTNNSLKLVTKDGQDDSMSNYNSYAMMIIFQLQDSGVVLKINFDSGAISEREVKRISQQLEHFLRQLCSPQLETSKVRDITNASTNDLDDIWSWNKVLPEEITEPVTELIDNMTAIQPEVIAISSWDKQLTYQSLKDLSISLAWRLREEGIEPGSVVVLNYEKSSWMTVSIIAVLRIGAIALPISAPASSQRARDISDTLQPKLCLTSDVESPFKELIPTFSIVDLAQSFDDTHVHVLTPSEILSTDPALVLFSSGTTGNPKAILWNHSTLSSNIRAAVSAFGLDTESRVFQFAGYEFDVSIFDALSPLVAGGCSCIPSETDRSNRLAGAIRDARSNWISITPSVSQTLSPAELPLLKTIVLAGERLQQKVAFKWVKGLDFVYNWFGPAEASMCCYYLVKQDTWKSGDIGRSQHGTTWLVNPRDVNSLAPVGAIAELCVEGPISASYTGKSGPALNEKSLFSPPWLQRGHQGIPGRNGQLYRTGDLVKYDTEGRLFFIGRKQDSQRKLRGQRVDLSEIEYRVQSFLSGKLEVSVVAEIFSPAGSSNETLAVFISPLSVTDETEDAKTLIKRLLPVDELEADLLKSLPVFMIPNLYVPVESIPITHTGKTDRRRLRQSACLQTLEQLAELQPSRREGRTPSTFNERRLQKLWAEVIGIDANVIYSNDNFLRLGGDSISAMRLVALARTQGFSLSVSDVFQAPQLEELARRMREDSGTSEIEVLPFALLNPSITEIAARSFAARSCSIAETKVSDMYPCTPLQEGLLALGARRHGQYVSRSVLGLQTAIDVDQLKKAWFATVERLPILRTRIVDIPGQGLVQVVIDDVDWRSGISVETYLREDEQEPMGLGSALCRVAIIDRSFILTIHHCTYDGNSLKMVLDELELQYLEKTGIKVAPFQQFIQYLQKIDPNEAADFWKAQLSKSELRQFPLLPSAAYEPRSNEDLELSTSVTWPRSGMTSSTIIRSAWAILTSQYTSSNDVIFGVTVSGRQADLSGIENCVAPTIATVPINVLIDWNETVESFLGRVQRQATEMTLYEQYGIQNIQRALGDLDSGLFQTLLVIQPAAQGKSLHDDSLLFKARSFASNTVTRGTNPFNTHALMLVCELTESGFHLEISFDNEILERKQVQRLACQFEAIIRQICKEGALKTKLHAIQTASPTDLDLFWTQNAKVPDEPTICVQDVISLAAKEQPKAMAIDSWDGRFLYHEVDTLSTILAHKLARLGVGKGTIVVLNAEKSRWIPIAQIAVLKAGGVFLLQSVAVPLDRVKATFESLKIQIALVSKSRKAMISPFAPSYTIEEVMANKSIDNLETLPLLQMNDPAAILVSSGSTGVPKQILWSHRALAANMIGQADCVGMNASFRVFQFASYDFDASTLETLTALMYKACLCIPSEEERLDKMGSAIDRFGATYMIITPSTAKILRPEEVPSMKILAMAGEKLVQDDVDRWKNQCHVLNWYGPAECSSATFCAVGVDSWHSGVIGRIDSTHPTLCWLVDPINHNRLAPFGAVGEIALEGPGCSDGYIGNPALTDRSFLQNPTFLSVGHGPERPGRRGLIYRTGDLARYDTNGNLMLLGRKDHQLKIRGQLVVPDETEKHVRRLLGDRDDVQVIVDAVTHEDGGNLTLVAFICPATQVEVEQITAGLNERLKNSLPRYAIPSYYIPLSKIPTSATGKRDRRSLLQIGTLFSPPQQELGSSYREPSTTAERTLRELWSMALGIDTENISAADNFLKMGDSIQAMRLVGMARQQGLLLTVGEIFQDPKLEDMAKLLKNLDIPNEQSIAPFSLLSLEQKLEENCLLAATLCGVSPNEIEDIFPTTQLQQGFLALTMKREGDYTGRNILELSPNVDLTHFKKSWEKVVTAMPILRTRIIDLPGQGLVQAIIRGENHWTEAPNVDEYIVREREHSMGLGSPLMKFALIPCDTKDSKAYFALTMHHSIYDGLTTPLILETLERYYTSETSLRHCSFQSFVNYIDSQDKDLETEFWKDQFAGLETSQFPQLPSSTYQPQTDSVLNCSFDAIAWRADEVTLSTVIRTAWGLVCSQFSNSSDVVFGAVVSGRKAPVGGIEKIAGPTIATVPIRITIDSDSSSQSLLSIVQSQGTDMIRYEQTGLSRIHQMSEDAQQACQFQSLVVVQPGEQSFKDGSLFVAEWKPENRGHRYHAFNTYAITLVCTSEENRLKVEFCFDSAVVDPPTIQRMSQYFEQNLRKLCSPELNEEHICNISVTTPQDLGQIWKWNAQVPESIERCLHHLISEVAHRQPDSIAVSAWDGELSYSDLDRLSTNIALCLVELGVRRNMIIPLCFEKSIFALIALLSVIKAGGAGLFIDPALPDSRIKAILQQFGPILIISSPSSEAIASTFVPKTLVLSPESEIVRSFMNENSGQATQELPFVDPSDLLYVIFTSGSTGTPKGCQMIHLNFSSAVTHQRTALRLNNTTRMYDFSSYTFDATFWSTFHTLASGGTLCIPSEDERKNNLTESMRKFRTTDVFLTPSSARAIDPSMIPTIRNVHLGGESVSKDDVAPWMKTANAFVSYGPAECSAGTLYSSISSPMPSSLCIGKGVGASTWIVDPFSSERLSPLGTIGELYLEGPLVGKGYLGDEAKTAASFIEDPAWLLKGTSGGNSGRRGRLYKTGDLVKYNAIDGSIIFVGRKDTQVKLRGQRVELSEVENHVRSCLASISQTPTVVAEVVTPITTGKPTLIVFIQFDPANTAAFNELANHIAMTLPARVSAYMVPDVYLPVKFFKMTAGGKMDRKKIRENGAKISMKQLSQASKTTTGKPSSTKAEIVLQKLWEIVLKVPAEKISTDTSFLNFGDSISAMRLAALARRRGISLTVQNILQAPRLSEMAQTTTSLDSENISQATVPPFSLLESPHNKEETLQYISRRYDIDQGLIEDIYPVTSVQKSLLSMTARSESSYIARFAMSLREDVDVERLKKAWEDVSQTTGSIVRCRILDVPAEGLIQVQLNEKLVWGEYQDLTSYLEYEAKKPMALDTPLTRLALVANPETTEHYCILTQHHAIYDGYSIDLLFREVSNAYAGIVDNSQVAPFQAFINHVVTMDQEETRDFWRQQFQASEAVSFPALPEPEYRPKANSTVKRSMTTLKWPKGSIGANTIIRAAWAILTARYNDTDDVVFGAMVTGRQAPISGIDRMIAPLINAVPVRVKFDQSQKVQEFLAGVQKQSVSMIPFEHTDLLEIRRLNSDAERGSHFNTLLVVQPARRDNSVDGPFSGSSDVLSAKDGLDDFNPNAVMIMCQLKEGNGLDLEISFDSKVIDAPQMERIASQFEHVLHQIRTDNTQLISDVETISGQDLKELWTWNAVVPSTIEKCVHELIGKTVRRQPDTPAICSWDGNVSYYELDGLSNALAMQLLARGVRPGSVIPLCFEKSMWHPIAALGAMKAGVTCVAMDALQPEARLRSIVQQVKPSFVLSSMRTKGLASSLSEAQVIIVDQAHLSESHVFSSELPKVSFSDVLYLVFTSGSTGTPKGVSTTHGNFVSASTHQAEILNIKPGTRVFDFVSYNFDVSWSNTLQTLICGGVLCIPSEFERKNDITGSLNRMNCDYVYFTPSVARSLEPSSMPGIRTLALGGEPIQATEVLRWKQAVTVIGIYGPAEVAQATSFIRLSERTRNNQVGLSYGANTWLVKPGQPGKLAAIGTVGELLIEGPTVSNGYFKDHGKTALSYIQDPPWLLRGAAGIHGRHGRLYQTGDLLKYNSDGSLNFVGRKDGMIKLRGQRIELGEVEYHVRASLQDSTMCDGIAAEIITPQNGISHLLAVFLSLTKEKTPISEESTKTKLTQVMEGLEERLSQRVPQYMVPGAYLHIDRIPMTTTNKTDRRALRAIGSTQTLENLAELQSRGKQLRPPTTLMEKKLQALWSSVLGIEAASIDAESSFLRIGGESIAAMRLVSAAREQNLTVTVADIFKAPRLSQLALMVAETVSTEDQCPLHEPFSLFETDETGDFFRGFVESFLDVPIVTVRDVIPATDFQETTILDVLQNPPSRLPHWILDLPTDVDWAKLEESCTKLVQHFDILQAVFIKTKGRFWQVLLSDFQPQYDNLDTCDEDVSSFTDLICAQDLETPRQLGRSFIRFMAVKHIFGKHKLIFRISHAQFDGFSWGLVLQTLSLIYNQESLSLPPAFARYISFNQRNKQQSLQHWTSRLRGSSYPSWSSSRSTGQRFGTGDRLMIKETIEMPDTKRHEGVSVATIFHAACALVLSRQFQQRTVVFGRLVTGRSMLPSDLQNVVGPTMTEVPIQTIIDAEDSVGSIALRLQKQFIEDSSHEAAGMIEIIRNCTNWPDDVRDFGWRTSFQQGEDEKFRFLGKPSKISFYESDLLPRPRPEIYATPREGKLDLEFEGNKRLISEKTVRDVLARLRDVLNEY